MDAIEKVFILIVALVVVYYLWGNPLTINTSVQDVSPGVVAYRPELTSSLYVRIADETTEFTEGFLESEVYLFHSTRNNSKVITYLPLDGQQYSIVDMAMGTKGHYVSVSDHPEGPYGAREEFLIDEEVVYLTLSGKRKGFIDAQVFNGVEQLSDWRDITTTSLPVSADEELKTLSIDLRENAVNRQFGNRLAGGLMFLVGSDEYMYAELSSSSPLEIKQVRVPKSDNSTYQLAFQIDKELVNLEKIVLLPKIKYGNVDPDSSVSLRFKIRDYDLFVLNETVYSGVETFNGRDLGGKDLEIIIPLE